MKWGKWLKIGLINLVIAAVLGASLRFAFIREIPGFDFRNVMHAHSHTAMLGWVFVALFSLLLAFFLPKRESHNRFYTSLFWLNQVALTGMLIAFPIQGYGGWAIFFSTFQIVISYIFAFRFLKELKQDPDHRNFSAKLARTAVWWMLFSTAGLWAMGPIGVLGLKGSAFYYGAVQFYLHFQFNGWFIFAILALFFRTLENLGIAVNRKTAGLFYVFLALSCLLTFALAVTWSNPVPVLFWINSTGIVFQLIALFFFFRILQERWPEVTARIKGSGVFLMVISLLAFILKILIQAAVVIPYIATIAYTIRNYVIGFIHLILLGMVTMFLLGFSIFNRWFSLNTSLQRLGIWLFMAGFFLSESLLFLQGTFFWAKLGFIPFYYEILFGFSALLPAGLLIFLAGQTTQTSPPPSSL